MPDYVLKLVAEVLSPTSLVLLAIVVWQFREIHSKDKNYHSLFGVLNNHTDAVNRLLGVLEGRRMA